jgi:hypothetical protein
VPSQGFVPLADVLRAESVQREAHLAPGARPEPVPEVASSSLVTQHVSERQEFPEHRAAEVSVQRFCGELALARLAAIEAYERAGRELIATLANQVLARELALAPSDIEALARNVLERFASEEPVAVVVSPSLATRICTGIPVRADLVLDDDDLVLEVRDGLLDLRLNVRLTNAIEDALP